MWDSKEIPDDWDDKVKEKMEQAYRLDSDRKLPQMSSLSVFRRLGAATTPGWLNRALNHPGAILRLKLRCGGAPLMERVGAMMEIDRPMRLCLMCEGQQVEDAEHFACSCPYYAAERAECLRRVEMVASDAATPRLKAAMQNNEMALFLGDGALQDLPEDKQRAVDTVVCNFLHVAWRKRRKLWRAACVEGNEWRLKA